MEIEETRESRYSRYVTREPQKQRKEKIPPLPIPIEFVPALRLNGARRKKRTAQAFKQEPAKILGSAVLGYTLDPNIRLSEML